MVLLDNIRFHIIVSERLINMREIKLMKRKNYSLVYFWISTRRSHVELRKIGTVQVVTKSLNRCLFVFKSYEYLLLTKAPTYDWWLLTVLLKIVVSGLEPLLINVGEA